MTISPPPLLSSPSEHGGRFGQFGGQYVPETIMPALAELEEGFAAAMADEVFVQRYRDMLRMYVGRPTPIYNASRFAELVGGGPVWLKREDLAHTGAHKINS